jgi:hypothetical protein
MVISITACGVYRIDERMPDPFNWIEPCFYKALPLRPQVAIGNGGKRSIIGVHPMAL